MQNQTINDTPGAGAQFFEGDELSHIDKPFGPPDEAPTGAVREPEVDGPAPAPAQEGSPQPLPAADATPAPATPDWNSPDNPYVGQTAEMQQALQWAEQQLLVNQAKEAHANLVAQGVPDGQAQQLVTQAIQSMAVERREQGLQSREAQLQQMAKPLYINQVVEQYKAKGVTLDSKTLMEFATPQEINAFVKAAELFQRSANFQERKNTNVDSVPDAPAGSGAAPRELTSVGSIAAGLMEADRRRR